MKQPNNHTQIYTQDFYAGEKYTILDYLIVIFSVFVISV